MISTFNNFTHYLPKQVIRVLPERAKILHVFSTLSSVILLVYYQRRVGVFDKLSFDVFEVCFT